MSVDGDDEGAEKGGQGEGEDVVVQEYEAYDAGVSRRLAALVGRRDRLVGEISGHRRGTAGKAGRAFEERWERETQMEMQMQGVTVTGAREMGDASAEMQELDVRVQREEEVRANWERAVEGLARLNKGLPETRARLERCGDVVGYLGGEAK